MNIFVIIALGYLIGSVPFALVVGKVFYHTDIRLCGSGNLGGGNAGRVLGKKAGLAVMTLDILKVTLVIFLAQHFCPAANAAVFGGLAAAVGHCFPVFAGFHGGKAVATMYGFLFGLWVVAGYSPLLFFLPLCVFMVILYATKIIALSSIGSAAAVTVFAALTTRSVPISAALVIFTLLIVVRHRANLQRIARGEENKISWM